MTAERGGAAGRARGMRKPGQQTQLQPREPGTLESFVVCVQLFGCNPSASCSTTAGLPSRELPSGWAALAGDRCCYLNVSNEF